MDCCAILDIGKTNIKLYILNDKYEILSQKKIRNTVVVSKSYNHVNVEKIWDWFVKHLRELNRKYVIQSINISAHGGAVALVNTSSSRSVNSSGLAMPIMDYEWKGIELDDEYLNVRPGFEETYSPLLPGGLNIGRQLFWFSKYYSKTFVESNAILMYPQYWAWRMSSKLVTEITSLGCHTDLWDVASDDYSSMVKSLGWLEKFPPICKATKPISVVSKDFADLIGLDKRCLVYSGLHDSNASINLK